MKTKPGTLIRLNPRILFALLLALPLLANAASYNLHWITVTNAPTTNFQTLTINGVIHRFTNNVSANPSTEIATNSTRQGSATNINNHLAAYKPTGVQSVIQTNETNVLIRTLPGTTFAVTIGGSWGYVTTDTLEATNASVVQVPATIWPTTTRTNVLTQLGNDLGAYATNALPTNTFWLSNFISEGPEPQTLLNDILSAGHVTGSAISNSYLTNITRANVGAVIATNLLAHSLTATGASLVNIAGASGTIGYVSNGVLQSFAATNLTGEIRGAYLSNSIGHTMTITNLDAPGSGANSQRIGSGSTASGDSSIAFGVNSVAAGSAAVAVGATAETYGLNGVALGNGATASTNYTTAIGTLSEATADYASAIGYDAHASHSNSTAIGYSALTTTTNQIRIGTASEHVSIPGEVRDVVITNAIYNGTNAFNSRITFVPRNNASLANGYNSGVVLGSNVYVRLHGPTAAYTNVGFASAPNGTWHILQFTNVAGAGVAILNDSGLEATAGNRILTGTGGLLYLTNNQSFAEIIYDADAARWRVIKTSN